MSRESNDSIESIPSTLSRRKTTMTRRDFMKTAALAAVLSGEGVRYRYDRDLDRYVIWDYIKRRKQIVSG